MEIGIGITLSLLVRFPPPFLRAEIPEAFFVAGRILVVANGYLIRIGTGSFITRVILLIA
jgi:hypothetical protein